MNVGRKIQTNSCSVRSAPVRGFGSPSSAVRLTAFHRVHSTSETRVFRQLPIPTPHSRTTPMSSCLTLRQPTPTSTRMSQPQPVLLLQSRPPRRPSYSGPCPSPCHCPSSILLLDVQENGVRMRNMPLLCPGSISRMHHTRTIKVHTDALTHALPPR